MKTRVLFTLLILTGSLLGLSGCNTFQHRVTQKAEVFNSLDAATQARLKAGDIRLGDTMDEVYIALGAPDEKRNRTTSQEQTTVWIYTHSWQEYRGNAYRGTHSMIVEDTLTGSRRVYYEPVMVSVYEDRTEEDLRVIFKDNRVIVIERAD
jgi:hypothetical protein